MALHPAMSIRPDDVIRSGIIQPFGVRATSPVAFARHEIDPFIQAIRPTGMTATGVHVLNGGSMIQGGGLGIVTAQPRTALQGGPAGAGLGALTSEVRTLLQNAAGLPGGLGIVTSEPRTALQGNGLGAMTYSPRTALQGMGIVSPEVLRSLNQAAPMGPLASWMITLGAPAAMAGAATYLATRSGRDAAFGALGGLLGGAIIGALARFGERPPVF